MGRLTALTVKKVVPSDKNQKLTDGDGLYLLVHPNGGKYWRYDYRYLAKRKTLALGTYPDVSLSEAREAHQDARKRLKQGEDPSLVRKMQSRGLLAASVNSFEVVAAEWYSVHMTSKSESYKARTLRILEKDLYPSLRGRPISEIGVQELLSVLKEIEKRTVDIAHRAKQTCNQIFAYAIVTGKAEHNPATLLAAALTPKKKVHYPTITAPAEVGQLLLAIDSYVGSIEVKTALQLSPLLFQRPGEIRQMEWNEINWTLEQWELPAAKMKMRLDHVVPLSKQSLTLLKKIQSVTAHRGIYVFPSHKGASRCLSDNAIRVALRAMGYAKEQIVPHGFRAMARTMLDEQLGVRPDFIERQLAHVVGGSLAGAYNRTKFLTERRSMMQAWADYLDGLKAAAV